MRFGLPAVTILELETETLPWAHRALSRDPPRRDVLDELRLVEKALSQARSAVERLLDAPKSVPHLHAARSYVEGGGHRHMSGGMRLNETSKSLAVAVKVVADAIEKVPRLPVRHQVADPFPIDRIYMAVQHGFVFPDGNEVPPKLRPSTSPTSAFRRMIGVCYEAMAVPNADPERAIKAYSKGWRELVKLTDRLGSGTEPPTEI